MADFGRTDRRALGDIGYIGRIQSDFDCCRAGGRLEGHTLCGSLYGFFHDRDSDISHPYIYDRIAGSIFYSPSRVEAELCVPSGHSELKVDYCSIG